MEVKLNRVSAIVLQREESRPPSRLSQLVKLWQKAGGLGFEPRQAESESAVLPLHHPPVWDELSVNWA